MNTVFPGLSPNGVSIVGFGGEVDLNTVHILGIEVIPLVGGPAQNVNFAFSAPRDGTITSIAAYFSSSEDQFWTQHSDVVTVQAQLWSSTVPNNVFTQVPGAVVTLAPAYGLGAPTGTVCHGITTGLSIPVTPETRFIMVFSATTFPPTDVNTVKGYASAGVTIE